MISHPHRCIFVHIPKCGGQSTETIFLRDLGLTWEQRAPLLMRDRVPGELGPPRLSHMVARDYVELRHVSQEQFDTYFTFSVVRDPHARAASAYTFLHLHRLMTFAQYVDGYLADAVGDPTHRMHWFLRPQVDFVHDGDRLLVDRLIRLEHLDAELPELAASLGVADTSVPHVNRTGGPTRPKPVRNVVRAVRDFGARPRTPGRHEVVWDDTTRSAVAELYAGDVALLESLPA